MAIVEREPVWLSVVIPAYHGEQWIEAALGSIAQEAPDGIEVVLVDGGPSTATQDRARSFLDTLSIRIFERPDLASWQAKTNFGVSMAGASHVCWLGVDDLWLPGRAKAVRSWITNAPDTVLHLAPAAFVDGDGRTLGTWHCPLPNEREVSSTFVMERLLVQNFIAAPAPIFRRDAWDACGGVDETLWYTADWDLWLKLACLGPVSHHGAVTVGFRIHGGSLTATASRDAAEFRRQMEVVLARHLTKLRSKSRRAVERVARTSIAINAALAAAAIGNGNKILYAASRLLLLGPAGIWRYWRDSRIFERALPRLRAKWAGGM